MAHNTRTHTDAEWTVGGLGSYITLVTDWADLDRKLFQAWNGDKGGCWAGSSLLTIGDIANTAAPSMLITGPSLVAYGGSVKTYNGSRFKFDPVVDGYPKLAAGHALAKRKVITSCVAARSTGSAFHWCHVTGTTAGVRSIALTLQYPSGTDKPGALVQPTFTLELEVHDGGRLTAATLSFRVMQERSAAPVATPRMRIVAVDASGTVFPLKKTDDGTGWVSLPAPSSGAAWFNSGNPQRFEYDTDQNNVIDTSQFVYYAQVIEEVGATTPPGFGKQDGTFVRQIKKPVDRVYTTVLPTGAAPDGAANGTRVLIVGVDVSDGSLTGVPYSGVGIYTVAAGDWPRAFDLDQPEDFTPGFLVEATGAGGASILQGSVWECAQPTFGIDEILSGTSTPPAWVPTAWMRRREPRGNFYASVACDFDLISDMRPS